MGLKFRIVVITLISNIFFFLEDHPSTIWFETFEKLHFWLDRTTLLGLKKKEENTVFSPHSSVEMFPAGLLKLVSINMAV